MVQKPTKIASEKNFIGELRTLIHWSDICCWSELVFSLSLCFFTSISIALSETHAAETHETSEKNFVGELQTWTIIAAILVDSFSGVFLQWVVC
jgi:hypothetical protein